MSEEHWPKDEYGFRNPESEWTAEERRRYEEHKQAKQDVNNMRAHQIRPILERFAERNGYSGTIGIKHEPASDGTHGYRFTIPNPEEDEVVMFWNSITIYHYSPGGNIPEQQYAELAEVLRQQVPQATVRLHGRRPHQPSGRRPSTLESYKGLGGWGGGR